MSRALRTVIYIDGSPYILEDGIDGDEVIFIDSETLTVVTTPVSLTAKE